LAVYDGGDSVDGGGFAESRNQKAESRNGERSISAFCLLLSDLS
jgi:hypothetical protein